jgi:hypothetical protein
MDRRCVAAAVAPTEKPVLAGQSDAPHRTLALVVVDVQEQNR